ncbi:MAG: hydantoinase B/oxoprolinase family protein [Proteobacteria bacterium]|nr:hydantoinase B/oxoprolinase family protein [Pseudomonadota bacterium]
MTSKSALPLKRGATVKRAAKPAAKKAKPFDPVLLEIMRHKVESIADEICITLLRTCRSVFVNEAADFAVGMVDLDGEVFGWAPENKTTAVNVPAAHTIRAVGPLEPGDAIVTNDPYSSDAMVTHLPDLHVIRPYFHGKRLVGYGWGFIHYMDVGGRFPGSISAYNTDVFQEGFRIPPMKLMRRGVLNEDFVSLFKANCRLPETNMSDLKAMLGSLEVGGRRVNDTINHYGVDTFIGCQRALKDYSAEKARNVLRMLPDGVYDFWDYLDDDLLSPYPVRVRARMTVNDGLIHFDVTSTDPQVDASYNLPTNGKLHNMLTRRITTFIRTHDKTIPLNAGTYRPLSITNPPGTILNAEFPDACGVRFATATTFNDAVTGLLLKAAPEKMAGPTCGTGFSIIADEPAVDGAPPKVIVAQVARGGMSAYHGHDGVDGRDVTMNTMFNHPIEVVEGKCRLSSRAYDVRTDSGGPGRWRGGVGQVVSFEAMDHGTSVFVRGIDRLRFPPWGVRGGRPGAPVKVVLDFGKPTERDLGKMMSAIRLELGQTLTVLTPGAAGYGDPFQRDPQAVRRDVVQGFVSRDAAERDYGVVIAADFTVEEEKTRHVRTTRVRENVGSDFDFGADREAWERIFDDETMRKLNRGLYALPKAQRKTTRLKILTAAVPNLPRAGSGRLVDVLTDPDAIRARLKKAMDEAFAGLPVAAE